MADQSKPKSNSGKRGGGGKKVAITIPEDTLEIYQRIARNEYISIEQVIARVAIEFAHVEAEASVSRFDAIETRKDRIKGDYLPESGRRPLAVLPQRGLNETEAAQTYSRLFSELLELEPEEALEFFRRSVETTAVAGGHGSVFVERSDHLSRNYECYASDRASACFHSGSWPIDIECRDGTATLIFTGKRFLGLPVMIEFGGGRSFGAPPDCDCILTLVPKTTIIFKSHHPAGAAREHSINFDGIASLLRDLQKRDALEELPGSNKKGIWFKLETKES